MLEQALAQGGAMTKKRTRLTIRVEIKPSGGHRGVNGGHLGSSGVIWRSSGVSNGRLPRWKPLWRATEGRNHREFHRPFDTEL